MVAVFLHKKWRRCQLITNTMFRKRSSVIKHPPFFVTIRTQTEANALIGLCKILGYRNIPDIIHPGRVIDVSNYTRPNCRSHIGWCDIDGYRERTGKYWYEEKYGMTEVQTGENL
jgi:hypothetical protein